VENLYPVNSTTVGTVYNVVDSGALVKLRPGVSGWVRKSDMAWGTVKHPSSLVRVGQDIEVMILEVHKEKRQIRLGLKQLSPNTWETAALRYVVGQKVKCMITNVVPYGAFAELEPGVVGLIRVSELTWATAAPAPSDVLRSGQEVEAVVLSVDVERQKLSLSLGQLEHRP
jgi:small subunit ribosomal protein S1